MPVAEGKSAMSFLWAKKAKLLRAEIRMGGSVALLLELVPGHSLQTWLMCSMTDGYDCYQNALAEWGNGILKHEFMLQQPNDLRQARRIIRRNR